MPNNTGWGTDRLDQIPVQYNAFDTSRVTQWQFIVLYFQIQNMEGFNVEELRHFCCCLSEIDIILAWWQQAVFSNEDSLFDLIFWQIFSLTTHRQGQWPYVDTDLAGIGDRDSYRQNSFSHPSLTVSQLFWSFLRYLQKIWGHTMDSLAHKLSSLPGHLLSLQSPGLSLRRSGSGSWISVGTQEISHNFLPQCTSSKVTQLALRVQKCLSSCPILGTRVIKLVWVLSIGSYTFSAMIYVRCMWPNSALPYAMKSGGNLVTLKTDSTRKNAKEFSWCAVFYD